ncbi:thioesterase domain-containing protein [Streptomyces sp. NPDC052101]|uniref:thioesterase II family protein n=1 Tax=Streptomyces sp. NPDC052101 TaxID=3155763 RepID=UPI00342F95B7
MPDEQPMQLHCFAHAGAGVSAFHGWPARLGTGVRPVPHLLPGRESRRREPRVRTREALLADLMGHFRAPTGPYALYGHSLGALVAYTLTRALDEAGLPGPALLAVGACPPPDVLGALSAELHEAGRDSEERLVRALAAFGAVPEGAQPGGLWHRMVLPVLRDDLILADDLRGAARTPLRSGPPSVPVLAVAGSDDPLAPPRAMAGWERWTAGRVVTRTLPGDHFFVRAPGLPRLLGRACRVVRRTAPEPAPAATREPAAATTGGRA